MISFCFCLRVYYYYSANIRIKADVSKLFFDILAKCLIMRSKSFVSYIHISIYLYIHIYYYNLMYRCYICVTSYQGSFVIF